MEYQGKGWMDSTGAANSAYASKPRQTRQWTSVGMQVSFEYNFAVYVQGRYVSILLRAMQESF